MHPVYLGIAVREDAAPLRGLGSDVVPAVRHVAAARNQLRTVG
jgi:hypothetical protein